jgi:hypothetical protein
MVYVFQGIITYITFQLIEHNLIVSCRALSCSSLVPHAADKWVQWDYAVRHQKSVSNMNT